MLSMPLIWSFPVNVLSDAVTHGAMIVQPFVGLQVIGEDLFALRDPIIGESVKHRAGHSRNDLGTESCW